MVFHGATKQTQNTVYTASKNSALSFSRHGTWNNLLKGHLDSCFPWCNYARYRLTLELCEAAGLEACVVSPTPFSALSSCCFPLVSLWKVLCSTGGQAGPSPGSSCDALSSERSGRCQLAADGSHCSRAFFVGHPKTL